MSVVRPRTYRNAGLVGPRRVVHCRQHRLRPNDRFALREPMCGISAQFLSTHQSVRLQGTIPTSFFQPFAFTGLYQPVRLHGTISDHFFFGPPLEQKLTIWTRFSVRVYDRAWEAFLLPSIGLLEQFLNAIRLELHEPACWQECYLNYG